MLPWGYTAAAGATEKTRHRMIGNGWHIGTAMFLLFTVLAETTERDVITYKRLSGTAEGPLMRDTAPFRQEHSQR